MSEILEWKVPRSKVTIIQALHGISRVDLLQSLLFYEACAVDDIADFKLAEYFIQIIIVRGSLLMLNPICSYYSSGNHSLRH